MTEQQIKTDDLPPVFNLRKWVEENRDQLKPPVGNKLVYDDEDFIVMAVGGPNSRKDYHHHDRGGEFFYMVEGDMILKVMDEETGPRDIRINEGDIFMMPGGTIHSPQRPPGSIGLVLELKAKSDDVIDRLYWYCEECNNKLHKEEFRLKNIVTELPPIMDKFFGSKELRTCNECGAVMDKPEPFTLD